MIAWTLLGCVILALSPGTSADDEMKIDGTCDTTAPGGWNWDLMAKDGLTLMGDFIPPLGVMMSIAGHISDLCNNAKNEDSKYAQNWKNCIDVWIDEKLTYQFLSQATATLYDMSLKLNKTIIKGIEKDDFNGDDFNDIKGVNGIGGLGRDADDIKILAEGQQNPQAFLIAYKTAFKTELGASYLLVAKMNETIPDPLYRVKVLKHLGDFFLERMDLYRNYLEHIDTVTLNNLNENKHAFWDDWGLHHETKGDCDSKSFPWMTKMEWADFECDIYDPTHRTMKSEYTVTCKGCGGVSGLWAPYKDDCNPTSCKNKLKEYEDKVKKAKDDVRKLLDTMKADVETAYFNFDQLANPKHLGLIKGDYCDSGCHGSEYQVECIKTCRLVEA